MDFWIVMSFSFSRAAVRRPFSTLSRRSHHLVVFYYKDTFIKYDTIGCWLVM